MSCRADVDGVPVRVLHVIPGLESGGAEGQLLTLGRLMASRGVEQRVVTMTPEGVLRDSYAPIFGDLFDIGMTRGAVSIAAVARFHRILKDVRPDLVHAWMYHACLLVAVTPARVPTVWSIRHGLDAPDHLRPLTRFIVRTLPALEFRARTVVFNSVTSRNQHVRWGYSERKSLVIPNGVDTDRFVPARESGLKRRQEFGIPEDHRVVGYLGRLHAVKGWDLFCRAAASVLRHRRDVIFVMAGPASDTEIQELHRLLNKLGIASAVRFIGFEGDAPRYLAMLDILVSPSRSEGFPNAVVEAMASGVPCVVTDVADNASIVGETGVVVDPKVESIGRGIQSLLDLGATDRDAIATAVRQRAVTRFGSAATADALVSTYRRLDLTR